MGTHGVVVRRATPADAPAVARLHVDAWRWAYAGQMSDTVLAGLDVEARRRMWERAATSGRVTLLVAEQTGRDADAAEVVGFVCCGRSRDDDTTDTTGEVSAIYLRREVQGTGVGRALMRAALGDLVARGCTEATLWVLATNTLGRSFYERGGWRPDGLVREEPEEDGPLLVELRYRRPLP